MNCKYKITIMETGKGDIFEFETDSYTKSEDNKSILLILDKRTSLKEKAMSKLSYDEKVILGLITPHDPRDGTFGLGIDYLKMCK